MMPEMEMVKDAALKYDKPTLGRMAQMGQISPTIAVMAGMMRDRIVQSEMKPPAPPTVAEEVLQPMGQRMGLGAMAPGAEMQGQPPQPPMQPPAPQGLDQIPVPDQMFEPQGMAGGGIVAFDNGGSVMFTGSPLGQNVRGLAQVSPRTSNILAPGAVFFQYMTDDEKRIYEATGVVPESTKQRYQQQASKQAIQPSFTQALAGPPIDDSAEMARLARQTQGTGVPMTPPPPPPRETPAAAPAAPTSAVPGLREQLMGRIREAYPDLAGGTKPAEPSVKGLFQERAEAERIAGVDKRFFENEAKRIVALSDKLKGDKNEAANMRLIEAGLRIMGGESPYAFVNIGKGASEALKGFSDDIKDIQKTKREYDKAERELRTAEQLYARNKSDEALKEVQRRRELAQERNTSFQKAMMDMELKLEDIGIRRETLGIQRQQVAQGASSPIERIADRLRKADPNLTYEQAMQKAYGMQQEPKTRAALEKQFLENPILVRQYGTYENYLKATSGGGTNYRERYGLE